MLEAGADINIRNKKGETYLTYLNKKDDDGKVAQDDNGGNLWINAKGDYVRFKIFIDENMLKHSMYRSKVQFRHR